MGEKLNCEKLEGDTEEYLEKLDCENLGGDTEEYFEKLNCEELEGDTEVFLEKLNCEKFEGDTEENVEKFTRDKLELVCTELPVTCAELEEASVAYDSHTSCNSADSKKRCVIPQR